MFLSAGPAGSRSHATHWACWGWCRQPRAMWGRRWAHTAWARRMNAAATSSAALALAALSSSDSCLEGEGGIACVNRDPGARQAGRRRRGARCGSARPTGSPPPRSQWRTYSGAGLVVGPLHQGGDALELDPGVQAQRVVGCPPGIPSPHVHPEHAGLQLGRCPVHPRIGALAVAAPWRCRRGMRADTGLIILQEHWASRRPQGPAQGAAHRGSGQSAERPWPAGTSAQHSASSPCTSAFPRRKSTHNALEGGSLHNRAGMQNDGAFRSVSMKWVLVPDGAGCATATARP